MRRAGRGRLRSPGRRLGARERIGRERSPPADCESRVRVMRTSLVGCTYALVRYQGPGQRSRESAASGRVQHGAGAHSVSTLTVHLLPRPSVRTLNMARLLRRGPVGRWRAAGAGPSGPGPTGRSRSSWYDGLVGSGRQRAVPITTRNETSSPGPSSANQPVPAMAPLNPPMTSPVPGRTTVPTRGWPLSIGTGTSLRLWSPSFPTIVLAAGDLECSNCTVSSIPTSVVVERERSLTCPGGVTGGQAGSRHGCAARRRNGGAARWQR